MVTRLVFPAWHAQPGHRGGQIRRMITRRSPSDSLHDPAGFGPLGLKRRIELLSLRRLGRLPRQRDAQHPFVIFTLWNATSGDFPTLDPLPMPSTSS